MYKKESESVFRPVGSVGVLDKTVVNMVTRTWGFVLMEESTLKIFIVFDDKEAVVFHTCVQSIIDTCKVPVSIHPLNLQMFQNYKETHSDGSNNFIYSRFLVPYLNNFDGKALFLDGDMIVNDDLNNYGIIILNAYYF